MTIRGRSSSGRRSSSAPPLDSELAASLAAREGAPAPPRSRDARVARMRLRQPTAADVLKGTRARHSELMVPRRDGGGEMLVSVFRPASDPPQPLPAFVFVHGGGMVAGNRFIDVEITLEWVERFGITVVTPEYRLAPENPFPAAMEDVYDVLRWTSENSQHLGTASGGVLLCGTSAGGGIAAQVGLLSRDLGAPRLLGQLLVCPMLDHRNSTVSSRQVTATGVWDRTNNLLGWAALLGAGQTPVPRYASPAREDDLSGLPPTYLDAGSVEVFRDEVVAYASRIWACGGNAELHVWAGGYHAFDILAPATAVSRSARAVRTEWVRRQLRDWASANGAVVGDGIKG